MEDRNCLVQEESNSLRGTQVLNEDFENPPEWDLLQNGIVTRTNVGLANAVSGDFVARKTK